MKVTYAPRESIVSYRHLGSRKWRINRRLSRPIIYIVVPILCYVIYHEKPTTYFLVLRGKMLSFRKKHPITCTADYYRYIIILVFTVYDDLSGVVRQTHEVWIQYPRRDILCLNDLRVWVLWYHCRPYHWVIRNLCVWSELYETAACLFTYEIDGRVIRVIRLQ